MALDFDKLAAVNRVLRAGGENPVSTLTSTSGDALIAEAILDEVNVEQQLPGLTVNSEELDVDPDIDGIISADESWIHVQALETDKLIVVRGTTLYNVTDNTDVFTDTLRLRVVIGMDFDDLPVAQRLAIADEAGRRYQMLVNGDPSVDAMLTQIWTQSRARARAQDMRSRGANIFGRWGTGRPWYAAKRTARRWWR